MFGGRELAIGFGIQRGGELYSPDFAMMEAHRATHAGEVKGAIRTAITVNRPCLAQVPVDRDISPIGTGSLDLPPLPNPEPSFLPALQARGLNLRSRPGWRATPGRAMLGKTDGGNRCG